MAGVAVGLAPACVEASGVGEELVATFWPELSETTEPLLQATASSAANSVTVTIENFVREYCVREFIIILPIFLLSSGLDRRAKISFSASGK